MSNVTLSLPHPIIFLLDVSNKQIQVPEYVAGVVTAATNSCISVNTQAVVDGDVTIRLGKAISDDQKTGCQMVFQGEVCTPGMRLAVVTSKRDTILDIDVPSDKTIVAISVDDPNGASLIVIEVQ